MEINIWADKYAPTSVEGMIGTPQLKKFGSTIIEKGHIPNMLLVGRPGIGKTSLAKILVKSLGADYLLLNASLKGNIDTLRNEISQFASTRSFAGGKKYIILDEADHLNQQSTQPALRNFIDTFSKNCGFILTANYRNRIIEPLQDRLQVEEFKFEKKDIPNLAKQAVEAIENILQAEKVDYDKRAIATYVISNVPSWRKIINSVQKAATESHYVGENLLSLGSNVAVGELIKALEAKDYAGARQWVADNVDNDVSTMFTSLERLVDHAKPQSRPHLIMLLAQYQYQAAFVADQEINIAAFCAEVMVENLL